MRARDQSSIFSIGGKFCPDYGLLLELHALTLVAALEQVVHNYVTILPQASLRPGVWNVWPLLIKMPWLFARYSLVRIEVGAEPYKRESLPVETKPELSHSVLSVSWGGRARHHVGFQSWALPTLMWAGYLSSFAQVWRAEEHWYPSLSGGYLVLYPQYQRN